MPRFNEDWQRWKVSRRLSTGQLPKKQLESDLAASRGQLAEYERKNLSDLELAQRERDDARKEAAESKALAQRAILQAKYPAALAFLGDDALPSEEKLAALNEKLAAPAAPAAPAPEPRVDPNRPPRTTPVDNRTDTQRIMDQIIAETPAVLGNVS